MYFDSENDENNHNFTNKSTKKRKKTGRTEDVMKKLRLSSHEQGAPCNCSRFKCFEVINANNRRNIIQYFNSLGSVNEQNLYLSGLINVYDVQRRRSRKIGDETNFHTAAYSYKIRVKDEENNKDVPVCFQAFISLHGITKGKVEYLQKSFKTTGKAPVDLRGKHENHKKIAPETKEKVFNHINSFKERLSHYSLTDSRKIYLPEDLTIKKMYQMFTEENSNEKLVSYESYRHIFNTQFNIAFGYPRMDTCSTCDAYLAKAKVLEEEKKLDELKQLTILNKLHLTKAHVFYDRKKKAKKQSKNQEDFLAIAIDFQKNISLPNITTNDVYYKRQLSMYSFNIHNLGTGQSYFYSYPETCAKKGSDEVVSFLFDFITNQMNKSIRHLVIFCDSCGGQNKNYTMLRFIHTIIHELNLLDSIKITFPIRGHSYLECDKNMGLINLKTKMELPFHWYELLKSSRTNPSPFEVIEIAPGEVVREWTKYLTGKFMKKCKIPLQKQKEVMVSREHGHDVILHRENYNGIWEKTKILNNRSNNVTGNEFELPDFLYKDFLPIAEMKYKDLMGLMPFCTSAAQVFYQSLKYESKTKDD